MHISCFGSSDGERGDLMYDLMYDVGVLIARRGGVVATGGYHGTGMQAAAEGAASVGGTTVGYLMQGNEGNPYLTNTVDCQRLAFNSKIPFFADWAIRLAGLTTDAQGYIVAAGGGIGTFMELSAIMYLNAKFWLPQKMGRPFAILKPEEFWDDVPGWNEEMLDLISDWIGSDGFEDISAVVSTPEQAVDWVYEHRPVMRSH